MDKLKLNYGYKSEEANHLYNENKQLQKKY